jgi:hypothetical protein
MNFFQKLSYRQKSRLLVSAAAVFLFMVYFLGIKKTIMKYRECAELEIKTKLAVNAPAELMSLEKNFYAMKKSTESYVAINVQQSLLGVVSKYCNENNLVVKDFTQPAISTNKDVTIETNSFVVEGPFTKALRLVYNLEQVNKLGRVASVNFSMKKDYVSKSSSLNTTVYIQNIKNESNEN